MRIVNYSDKQFDEAKYTIVDRHDLHALARNLTTAIQNLETNRVVTTYKNLDNIHEMLGGIMRMNNRLFTFDEGDEDGH